jgi:DNA adenine methylase
MIHAKNIRTSKTHSPLRWFGGKYYLSNTIISLIPENHQTYVEPFGGGAHVLARKLPSAKEVYNDIDTDVVNFLKVMKEDKERLIESLITIPTSRYLLEKWRSEPLPEDRFERAVRWFYLLRQRITPTNNNLKSGWRAGKYKNSALDYQNAVMRIHDFAERMKNVQIENRDFREIIKMYDSPDTVFFVDPPYVEREHHYKGNFTKEDHIELAQLLKGIQGKAIVTYYTHPLIEELYRGWIRYEEDSFVAAVGAVERRRETEIIFCNFDNRIEVEQLSLF